MRLYAIFVYIILLNLVFGFVATAITAGWFLPEAQGVISLPTTEAFSDGLNTIQNISSSLGNTTSGWEWIGTALTSLVPLIGTALGLLFSLFGSMPAFILSIMGLDAGVVTALSAVLSAIMCILAVFTAIQLITGKWFSFVE